MQTGVYKRDKAIVAGSDYKFCCVGHDGTRKSHKKGANRKFRRQGRWESHDERAWSREEIYGDDGR